MRSGRVLGALAAAAMIIAAGCAPGSDNSGGDDEPSPSSVETDVASMGDITLTVWDQEVRSGQDKPLQELNKEFMERYPNITIKRVSRSFTDLQKQLRLAITGNDVPDVVQANNTRGDMGAFVKAGLLRPLDSYAEVYGWDDRFPASIRAASSYSSDGKTFGEGNLYGLPLTGEFIGVWFNKAKLDKLGIEPPTTLADFEAALKKAKDAGEIPIQFGDKEGWPGIHELGFLQDMYAAKDDIRTLGYGREGGSWDTAENKKAAQTLVDWVKDGYFTDGFNGIDYDPSWQAFAKGQGVFLISGTWLLADLQPALGDDLGFMLPPTGDTGDLTVTGATGLPFAITKASKHADAAAAYIDFITSKDAMAKITKAGGLPIVDSGVAVSGTQKELFDAWEKARSEDALVPYLDWSTPDAYDLITADVQELMGGDKSVDDVIGDLQKDYSSFVADNAGG